MAGHSHAKTVMHTKEKNNAKKAKLYTKLARELSIAARGNPNIETNSKLAAMISKVKSMGLPRENIERTLKSAAGDKSGKEFETVIFDAYWNKIPFVVVVETDNNARTSPEIKNIFAKAGGAVGTPNSAASSFSKKGLLSINLTKLNIPFEELEGLIIDYNAEDYKCVEDNIEIYFSVDGFATNVKKTVDALEKFIKDKKDESGFIEEDNIVWIPENLIDIDEDKVDSFNKLLSILEDQNDVTDVFHGANIS